MKSRLASISAFSLINGLFFCAFCALALFPLLNVLAVSLSSSRAINSGEVSILPIELNFDSYLSVLENGRLAIGFQNTVVVTAVGTALNLLFTILAAYGLSKKRMRGRKLVIKMIVFTMMFSGGIIPSFILVKSLGLMNTYGALWLPGLISTYLMIIMKSFFENIPASLEESASIDGANDLVILIRIILPVSTAVLATVTLFYAVGWWNGYMNVLLYINDTSKATMMLMLQQMIANVNYASLEAAGDAVEVVLTQEGVKSASIVISVLPILCVYPFLQKYFMKGMLVGSMKG